VSTLPFRVTDHFPDIAAYPSQAAIQNYVLRQLVDLARRGEMFLTELLPSRRQHPGATFAIGNIIGGQELSASGLLRPMHSVPRELRDARVTIRSVPFLRSVDRREPDGRVVFSHMAPHVDTVRWSDRRPLADSSPEKAEARALGLDNLVTGDAATWQTYLVDTGKTEISLPMREAWLCLKSAGAYCQPAKRSQTRASLWRFREVNAICWPADGEPLEPGAWSGELPVWAGGVGSPLITEQWAGDDEPLIFEEPRRTRRNGLKEIAE